MVDNGRQSPLPRVAWVYAAPVASALPSASRVETTRELRRLGWAVTLVTEGPTGSSCIRGVEVYCLSRPRVYLLGVFLFHMKLLHFLFQKREAFDLILFHQISALWLLPLRLLRRLLRLRRPLLVMDTRDVDVFEGTLRSVLRRQFTLAMHWLANRWADGQTAITTRMAELVHIPLVQLWGVWPSGVDLARFAPALAGRQPPGRDGPVHLIYIGKMRVGCNLEPLCQAVERANAEGAAFLLSLIGEGPERPRLEKLAHSSGGRIRVQPAVPSEGVPELLRQAHVGVTALFSPDDRLFGASSPLKLFEYMAAGLPILSTRNPCHTEVVGEGSYGFWAADASENELVAALRQVWQARDTLGEKGMQAAAAATAWTWAASAQKLGHALQRGLLEGGVGSAHGVSE